MWRDHHECGSNHYVDYNCSKKMSPFTVDLTCVNLSTRVNGLRYYPWDPRLDNPSRYPLWSYCQLHVLHLLLLLFPLYPPLIMHTLFANCFLPYCRHHLSIKHSSLHLHEYHINTCTNYTEISDGNKWNNVMPTLRTKSRKIFKVFNVRDYMMVRIYPK